LIMNAVPHWMVREKADVAALAAVDGRQPVALG